MGRQARLDYPGAYHHIISRGFKKEIIFQDDNDYCYYINCLERFKNYDFKILEYCIMPNHIHLLMQTGEISLQKILKSIHTRFALYKTKKRGLPGPVFQGRPKSILITDFKYLKVVSRYILRNPLKANLVKKFSRYKWSSYNYLTKFKVPEWYDNSVILDLFSYDKIEAIKLYKKFISKPLKSDEKEYPIEIFNGIAAGSKVAYEKILKNQNKNKRKKRLAVKGEELLKNLYTKNNTNIIKLRRSNDKNARELKSRVAYILKEICHKESVEILSYLNICSSTLSNYIRKINQKIIKKELKLENLDII